MAITTHIFRILVGVLFILSGLVKANDPLGLSYKMQEFFEVWSADLAASGFFAKAPLIALFQWLHEYTLPLSIVMITLEIGSGVALLAGWRPKAVLRLLLVLIVFFTFLTAYAYGSGKFKNCGCFGDCLPISPLASLLKDIALLVMILVLWWGRRYIQPWVRPARAGALLFAAIAATLAVQWYVLQYLPFADCLPFKKGANISQQMQIPAGARPDSFVIQFVYEKEGIQHAFDASNLPADLGTYKYVSRVDKLVRKGNAEPSIKGFALTGLSGADSTDAVLALPEAYLLIAEQLGNAGPDWADDFARLAQTASSRGIPVLVATSAPLQGQAQFLAEKGISNVSVFSLDFTAVRTAARTNPTLYHLKRGTIQQKYSKRQIDEAF
ncbi:BT_3928 family protein [Paracnuella aquatica]|uniref:BT_3928 family protein n=1 Tax=Paracnuella aquatica TaxID=2268757 RepID=UPI000DEFA484|nr:BT_3928 family protein [Paracnuella aquatica]RPD51398.1 DoxX family protein [Paracnuella aquatica]